MTHLLPSPAIRAAVARTGTVVLMIVAATLLYLWQHFGMVELGYRVEQARADLAVLKHQRAELLVEVASLSSLDRIERLARERLGMAAPAPAQLVRVIEVSPEGPAGPGGGGRSLMLAANAGR
jgi:cell division protein FtsL